MNPPQITLKLIVLIHFILTCWATLNPFLGISYVYMNLFVLSLGIWSIAHHESADTVLMFLMCHAFSILQDIILLGLNEPRGYMAFEYPENVPGTNRNEYRFSLGMSIVNLIIKPVTAFLLYRIYKDRGGNYSDFSIPGVGNLPGFGAGHTGAYEDIDTPAPPSSHTDQQYEHTHQPSYADAEKR